MRLALVLLSIFSLACLTLAVSEPAFDVEFESESLEPTPVSDHDSIHMNMVEKRARVFDVCANFNNVNDPTFGQLNGVYCTSAARAFVQYKFPNLTRRQQRDLIAQFQILIARNGVTCIYPQYSTPVNIPGTVCLFTCSRGYTADTTARTCACTTPGRVDCGGRCVRGSACVSGIPVARRAVLNRRSNGCPPRHLRCGSHSGKGTECIDPNSDLESCGGCMYGVPGEVAKGKDCTAIEGISAVSCESGSCRVHACKAGYRVLNGTSCELTSLPLLHREAVTWPKSDL